MEKIEKIVLALIVALFFAITSYQIKYYRTHEVGPGCGPDHSSPCIADVLQGGIPFAFVVDSYNDSGIGRLEFGNDTFVTWAFLGNMLFFLIPSYLLINYIYKKMSWPEMRGKFK